MRTDDTGYITEGEMLTSAESDSIDFKDATSPLDRVNMSESKCISLCMSLPNKGAVK